MRVSCGHLCEAEAPTKAVAEIRWSCRKNLYDLSGKSKPLPYKIISIVFTEKYTPLNYNLTVYLTIGVKVYFTS